MSTARTLTVAGMNTDLARIEAIDRAGRDAVSAEDRRWLEEVAGADAQGLSVAGRTVRASAVSLLREWSEPEPAATPTPAGLKLVGDAPPPPALSQGNPVRPLVAAPPVNHAAEAGVLAAALADNAVMAELLELLEPRHFADPGRRAVFAAMAGLHGEGQAFDVAVLLDALARSGDLVRAGGATAVHHLGQHQAPPRDLALRHAEIVRRDAEDRDARDALNEWIRVTAAGKARPADAASRVRELLDRLDPSQGDSGDELACRNWPEPPGESAWHGVAGQIVEAIAPETEADPVSILTQFLTCFGNSIGRTAYWSIGATRHYCNLFTAVVGQSSRGRKGTAWEIVKQVAGWHDPEWRRNCIQSGLTTGEGLITAVRDDSVSGKEFLPGVEDKRALWLESEFSSTLTLMNRDGNSLSGTLRKAWDGDDLRSASKNEPVRATGAHVSLVGHTTFDELKRKLGLCDTANGFANRFLWVCTRRARVLPYGGDLFGVNLDRHRNRVQKVSRWVKARDWSKPVPFHDSAKPIWEAAYAELTRVRTGDLGSVTDRAEAQVRRLAVIYAVLDCSPDVKPAHLAAAVELWGYCERSAAYIFGDARRDPIAEAVLSAVTQAGEQGVTLNELTRTHFRGRRPPELHGTLARLVESGVLVADRKAKARGRRGPDPLVFALAMLQPKGQKVRGVRVVSSE